MLKASDSLVLSISLYNIKYSNNQVNLLTLTIKNATALFDYKLFGLFRLVRQSWQDKQTTLQLSSHFYSHVAKLRKAKDKISHFK